MFFGASASVGALFDFLGDGMAKIDKLGRIVIPKEYRKQLGIELEDEIDISLSDGAVTIRPRVVNCCVCGTRLDKVGIVPLCERCIDFVSACRSSVKNPQE